MEDRHTNILTDTFLDRQTDLGTKTYDIHTMLMCSVAHK